MGRPKSTRTCDIEGCGRKHLAVGLCSLHWNRQYKKKPMNGPPYYARGWLLHGYRWISTPDGREMLEHRYFMEQHLGRRLHVDECVHHKDGNKTNNDLRNLEVVDRTRHTSLHQYEGGRRRPAICPECGQPFMRLAYAPNRTCSQRCGFQRLRRQRRVNAQTQ